MSMVKTTVSSEILLGTNYKRCTLEVDDYTPSIDDTVTFTATVTDVYGDPIEDETIILRDNGSAILADNASDENGEVEFNVQMSDWDVHNYVVELNGTLTDAVLSLKATGWKLIYHDIDNYYDIYKNENLVRIDIKQYTNNVAGTLYQKTLPLEAYPLYHAATISSSISSTDGGHFAAISVNSETNKLDIRLCKNTAAIGGLTIYGQIIYPYR